jgi:hypothetical protein
MIFKSKSRVFVLPRKAKDIFYQEKTKGKSSNRSDAGGLLLISGYNFRTPRARRREGRG